MKASVIRTYIYRLQDSSVCNGSVTMNVYIYEKDVRNYFPEV
jgi:hypothetical protein